MVIYKETEIPDISKAWKNAIGEELSDNVIAINERGIMRIIYYNFTNKSWFFGFPDEDYSEFKNNSKENTFVWMYKPVEFKCDKR